VLNDEQLDEIRTFCESPTAMVLFALLRGGVIADWTTAKSTLDREDSWRMYQAIERLEAMLRDAPAMKRLNEKAQAGRVYRSTTTGV
jgi:hypothetical protein